MADRRPVARFTRTVTARTVLVTCVVALVSVLATALVGVLVGVRAANQDARERLNEEATIAGELLRARLLTNTPSAERQTSNQLKRLAKLQIDFYIVQDGQVDRAGPPTRVVKAVAGNLNFPAQLLTVDGRLKFVAGHTVGTGDGVILMTDPPSGSFRQVFNRIWVSLLAGLLVGLLAGVLLARRIARPMRDAALAAGRLSAGDRTVRLVTRGPAEVDELANALNDLAAALATSEGRQRDFLLTVSHELRTPLTTIKGYAEALSDGVVGPDGAQRAGQTMLDESERLGRLIADLLVLARLEAADLPIEIMHVDLTQLVGAAAEAWGGRVAAAGLVLHTELPSTPVLAYTDPGRVRQILDGLLENALRVVPSGSPVVLAVRAARTAPYAAVEIRDGGPGFTDGDLAVAFERGALHRRYRGVRKVGSGLGLALAARLSRRLGGAIEAGHAPEGGARFTVSLPVRPA